MSKIKKLLRFCRMLVFGFMIAVCIVLGVAPVIPKRKEEYTIEIKIEVQERKADSTVNLSTIEQD